MELIIKSLRDIKSLDKFFFLSLLVSGSINFFWGEYLKGDIDLNQILQIVIGTIIGAFVLLLYANLFFRMWVKSQIKVSQVSQKESGEGKLLLKIENNNFGDAKFSDIGVNLIRLISADEKENFSDGFEGSYIIRDVHKTDKSFKKGLEKNKFEVSAGKSIIVEIGENISGLLKLSLPEPFVSDWAVPPRHPVLKNYWGIDFVVSGKIAGFSFSKRFLWKFLHEVCNVKVTSGTEEKPIESLLSWIKWIPLGKNG